MTQYLVGLVPLGWGLAQQLAQQVSGLLTHVLLYTYLLRSYFQEQLLLVLSLERTVAVQHVVQQDAERPAVRLERRVRSFIDNLRRHVGGGAAEDSGVLLPAD